MASARRRRYEHAAMRRRDTNAMNTPRCVGGTPTLRTRCDVSARRQRYERACVASASPPTITTLEMVSGIIKR
ncbi:MAG: hypothetical protein ABDI19_08375 [Armatimonadota bacterium]